MTRRSNLLRWGAVLASVVASVAVCLVVSVSGRADGAVSAPSGIAAPQGDIEGWRQVFVDDFAGSSLNESDWGRYSGVPGGDPVSYWDPGHTVVRDGILVLQGYEKFGRLVTGGAGMWSHAQQYGKWEVRVRADPSDAVTYHLLLWPENEIWPPEVDFAESFGGGRAYIDAFVHWTDAQGQAHKAKQALPGDFTQWQTLGVEWLPGEIRYTLNGRVWGTETGDRVPSVPMWLGIQAQAGGCQKALADGMPPCPWVGTPALTEIQVDWVSVYEPAEQS
ncbi:glycoside hydrolase family 16 protein [Nocardia flavorosea]|uniref:Glycoside hydrolase family 16 protein n=1 Tax=Nocardia flavorosea TaxID=53429 RepID=A0A846YH97_9NOCA|nr:glycoside hydrolase family 16 protein [Nocardia flavorosea]NKY57002.1 glycoside hydrolase family 16 protein [Nocardia flavorosea]